MTNFIFEMHSGVRWIVVLIGLILLFRSLYAWLANRPSAAYDNQLSLSFSIAIVFQFVLGLILFFVMGTYSRFHFEHLTVMFIAVALAGYNGRWRKKPDPIRFRNTFITIAVVAVLIYLGVAVLPGGGRWF